MDRVWYYFYTESYYHSYFDIILFQVIKKVVQSTAFFYAVIGIKKARNIVTGPTTKLRNFQRIVFYIILKKTIAANIAPAIGASTGIQL